MKQKWKMILGCIVLTFCLGACGMDKNQDTQKTPTDSQKEETKKETEQKSDQEEEQKGEQDKQEQTPQPVEVKIYYSNEDATGFATENVQIEELTAENLLMKLSAKGVLPADIKALSCEKVKNNGEDALHLDVSAGFSTYLTNQGTTGEMITVGSICNTFLDAFQCKGIKITVAGETLASSHAEYPGYLSYFENVR